MNVAAKLRDKNNNLISIIEYDGKQHYEFTSFFQSTYQNFVNQVNRDRCLEQYCKENNIKQPNTKLATGCFSENELLFVEVFFISYLPI